MLLHKRAEDNQTKEFLPLFHLVLIDNYLNNGKKKKSFCLLSFILKSKYCRFCPGSSIIRVNRRLPVVSIFPSALKKNSIRLYRTASLGSWGWGPQLGVTQNNLHITDWQMKIKSDLFFNLIIQKSCKWNFTEHSFPWTPPGSTPHHCPCQ